MSSQTQQPPYGDLQYKFNASMAIIVVVLVTTFFFMALFVLYIRRCNLASVASIDYWAAGGVGRLNDQQHLQQQRRQQEQQRGLDPEALAKLPILRYASIKSSAKRGKAGSDCSVCLLAFEESDKLRLLPACAHVFHAECIDLWLETHSTCPLCRRSLSDAQPEVVAESEADLQRAVSAVVSSFRRDSLPPDSSPEQQQQAPHEQEQDLVTRTLSRNSESFRIAQHDLELMEVREKLRARSLRFQSCRFDPTDASFQAVVMPPSPREGPLRRSVSDGEHLIWIGNGNGAETVESSAVANGSLLFPAFARKSLKWLVSSSTAATKDQDPQHYPSVNSKV